MSAFTLVYLLNAVQANNISARKFAQTKIENLSYSVEMEESDKVRAIEEEDAMPTVPAPTADIATSQGEK